MQVWFPWWFAEQKLRGKKGEELQKELETDGYHNLMFAIDICYTVFNLNGPSLIYL